MNAIKVRLRGVARLAGRFSAQVSEFVAWWLQELRETAAAFVATVAPARALRFVLEIEGTQARLRRIAGRGGGEGTMEMTVGQNGELPSAEQLWPAGAPRDARAEIRLPDSAVLVCPLSLPPVSDRELPAVVALQLERKLPLPRENLYLDWRATNKAVDGRRSVLAVVAHRGFIDTLRTSVTAWGWRLTAVRPAMGGPRSFNLLPERSHALRPSFSRRDVQLLGMAIVLICSYMAIVAGQWVYERVSVQPGVRESEARIAAVTKLQAELAESSKPLVALRGLMASPSAGDTLLTVSAVMPSASWLYQAEIDATTNDNGVLELEGFAPSAAALVESLERSSRFRNVTLVEAASGGIGSAGERFKMSAGADLDDSP